MKKLVLATLLASSVAYGAPAAQAHCHLTRPFDPRCWVTETLIDSFICGPVLSVLFPPEGDIVLPDPIGKFWDCPPYDV